MNTSSLLKMGFFDKIATFFDIIPKVIYFLSATLLSGIDILHCMIRKLAGLDVYYVNGTAHAQQDPLSEFVYGILGIGESAPLYKGLNTVFWSLAIFGIICLVVTTMIAIIKSHYNEDTAGTSPMKYIYTAIKAVLTFAVIPFVVVFGINLASFALRTLDQITAGTATSEDIDYYFGAGASNEFKGGYLDGQEGTGTKYYSRYDFFGFGAYTSSTTFSGMLFKACAYDANRARGAENSEDGTMQWMTTLDGYDQIKTDSGFTLFKASSGDAAKLADSFDFAFANNLNLEGTINYEEFQNNIDSGLVPYWEVTDLFKTGLHYFGAFSKYDTSLLWFFYNLWQYNFVVAFGGGVTMFGIFLSIIIGLFSRLIKGAALFLVYPATLGLAPLDNFKAFKSWGTQFMQQVLMAFGAILGVNLVLLIMPYVQNIQFFNRALLDYMINVVIVMTAMIMTKDFIGIVSGFVGGADAVTAGDSNKAALGSALAKGIKGTAFAAKIGVGAMKLTSIPNMVHSARTKKKRKEKEYKDAESAYLKEKGIDVNTASKEEIDAAKKEFKASYNAEGRQEYYDDLKKEESDILTEFGATDRAGVESAVNADVAGKKTTYESSMAEFEAIVGGDDKFKTVMEHTGDKNKAMEAAVEMARMKDPSTRTEHENEMLAKYDQMNADKEAFEESHKNGSEKLKRYDEIQTEKKNILGDGYVFDKSGKIKKQNGWDAFWMGGAHNGTKEGSAWRAIGNFGKTVGFGVAGIDPKGMKNAGAQMADGFLKALKEVGSGTGLSTLFKGAKDLKDHTFTMKGGPLEKDPKKTGDDLTKDVAQKSEEANKSRHKEQTALLEDIKKALEEMAKKMPIGGGSGGSGGTP